MKDQSPIREGIAKGIVLFTISLVVYGNYLLAGVLGEFDGVQLYVLASMSAFVCALLLQGEKIALLYRQREFLTFHKELLILSGIFFLLGFMKLWYTLLFPADSGLLPHFSGAVLAGNTDLLLMFGAGTLLVDGFSVKADTERQVQKSRLQWYLFLLVFLFATDYVNLCFFQSAFSWRNSFVYILYGFNLLKILVCALGVQAERIRDILRNRTAFCFSGVSAVLGLSSLLLATMKLGLSLFWHSADSSVIQAINNSDLWQVAYTFAAGLLLVESFQRRSLSTEEGSPIMEAAAKKTS